MLIREAASGQARYRLLETVREYGLARLSERGAASVFRRRHRDYYLRLAERAEAGWFGSEQEQVYAMLADIASSSWDQMLADTKEHRRPSPLPTPILDAAHEEAPAVAAAAVATDDPSKRRSRLRRALLLTSIASVATIVVLIGLWVISERW